MIQRNRNYHKKAPSRNAQKLFIICEGNETEPNYFSFFEGLTSNLSVIPIPSKDGKSDPVKLMEWARDNILNNSIEYEIDIHNNDMVWFVIDTDQWQKQGKIALIKEFCSMHNNYIFTESNGLAKYKVWNVAQSNPQFEIWHYYHIYEKSPNKSEVDKYSSFKEFVDRKINGGFDFKTHPAYIEDAIKHSKNNFKRDSNKYPKLFSTEVYLLCQEILKFVKKDIDVLKKTLTI